MAEFEAKFKSKELDKFLSKITSGSKDVEKANKKYSKFISVFVFQDIIDHFEKESGPKGTWDKWSSAYMKLMERIGKGGNKVLQDSGRLRQHIMPIEKGGNVKSKKGQISWVNPAKTKSGFPYAAAHDEGGPKLPQREFMWLSNKAFEKISVNTLKYIMEKK